MASLPDRFPTVPGLTFAAYYVAASTDDVRYVGGDWYDAFSLPDGSIAIVIGDVAGHGLDAAVVMGQVRNGMRSLFTVLHDPAEVVAAMDRQLASAPELVLVTTIVCVYRDGELRWANAGHPPLLLAPAAGPSRYLTATPNQPLGLGDGRYDTHRSPIEPGDVVLGYTDGVMEHRARSLDEGLDRLRRLLDGTTARDPQALCDLLLDEGLSGLVRDDDACLLAVRRDHPGARDPARLTGGSDPAAAIATADRPI